MDEIYAMLKGKNIGLPQLGVVRADDFSKIYPRLNEYIYDYCETADSRNGEVKELLDFKTILTDPYKRCVGVVGRNMNVFFCLAEAMWIVTGRKDVEFLTLFNSRMADYSDDGKVFHAPYGFRLRHWGIRSEDNFEASGLNAAAGYDQVLDAIKLLTENPNSRQVVMSIWNPSFDLGYKTKDLPCNDIVMLKIRNGKLITTIANRSNDLHWGLPTNIFQFSFLTEVMALCLGIELGTQTHNSQSLHLYTNLNDVADKMYAAMKTVSNVNELQTIYDVAEPMRMEVFTNHEVPVNRFRELESVLNIIIDNLIQYAKDGTDNEKEIEELTMYSEYFYYVYFILRLYLDVKRKIHNVKTIKEKDEIRLNAINLIETVIAPNAEGVNRGLPWDVKVMAQNFFAIRMKDFSHPYLGKL